MNEASDSARGEVARSEGGPLRLHNAPPPDVAAPLVKLGFRTKHRPPEHRSREHRRRRMRRRGRRAYIRSVYFLPSLATLGNAICGFAAMYVAAFDPENDWSHDTVTEFFIRHHFVAAAYLIF